MQRRRVRERVAYVLDYLREGNPLDRHARHRNQPLLKLLGEDYFTLMEVVLRRPAEFQPEQKIDMEENEEVRNAKEVLDVGYDDLTSVAKDNLITVLNRVVEEKEKEFVEFFNRAESLTLRLHSLELLPGIGKKSLRTILEERKRNAFSNYKDIEERTKLKGIKQMLIERILTEIKASTKSAEGEVGEKYFLFVQPQRDLVKSTYIGYLERIRQGRS